MEIAIIIEKAFFIIFFIVLIAVLIALVIQLNNSAKRTRLLVPFYARISLLLEAVFLAGSIILILLSK